jgi:hypothetical protein
MRRGTKDKKVDYNIEYAHIYADESFGTEQKRSIRELHRLTNRLKRENKSHVLTVLIDEYNPIQHKLNIANFRGELARLNAEPDYIGLESKLAIDKDLVLREMGKKMKKEYENYIRNRKKIPCSLMIALWYLKRLGLIETATGDLINLKKDNRSFIARKIITILPIKYRRVETKALKIIKSTRFKKYLGNIQNIFFA